MSSTDRYAEWDAAYVLGSLSSADRHEYERHLAGCPQCRAAVAELAALPGLLARVPAADVATEAEGTVPGELLPNLVQAAARRRRRGRIAVAAMVAVAAAIAIVVPLLVTGPLAPRPEQASDAVTLSQVVASPLQAEVRLVENHWGTRIDMSCHYRGVASDYGPGAAQYALWVIDAGGSASQLATWTASPGDTAEPSATTSLPIAQIRSVEVRAVGSGTVLLRSASLGGAE